MMAKELIKDDSWFVSDNYGKIYAVNFIYKNTNGGTIIGITGESSGFYMEFDLIEFYRVFTYKLKESL